MFGFWLRLGLVGGVLGMVSVTAAAQERDRLFLPPLWDEDAMRGIAEGKQGENGGAEREPLFPGLGSTEDVVPVVAGEVAGEGVAEGVEAPMATVERETEAGISGGVTEQLRKAEEAGASSILGYLEERRRAAVVAPAPGLAGVAAVLFGCPRSVLQKLLEAATAKPDIVSSLDIEREVLTLCGERQKLVAKILQAEAELAQLWRESRVPPPEEAVAVSVDVVAQLTEFAGAKVVDEAVDAVVVEPEPEPSPYGWFSIFGMAGDLKAGVSDGDKVWFVRVDDELPGGVVVDWISVRPPGVHVVSGDLSEMLPYRAMRGESG